MDTKIFSRKLRLAIFSSMALTLGSAGSVQAGHPVGECQKYAKSAVDQFRALRAAGCAGKPGDNLWSDYYDGHYNWCISKNGDLGQEFKKRRLSIEACQRHSDGQCQKYATDAVNQTRQATRSGCPNIVPPVWSEFYQGHYDWCKSNIGADLGQQFKTRRLAIESCTNRGGNISLPRIQKPNFCTDALCTNCKGILGLRCELDSTDCPNASAKFGCFGQRQQ